MYVRFLCVLLTAALFGVASSSFAFTPLNLRISAPTLTESLQEHLRQTWAPDIPFIRWSLWGDATYTSMTVKDIGVSADLEIERLSDGQFELSQNDLGLEEELEAATLWGGIDFHLGQNVLIGLLGSYQTSDSNQTFGESSLDTSLDTSPLPIPLPTVTDKDTTRSFGGGAYLGFRFQTITLHTAIAAWIGEVDEDTLNYDTRDLFLSAALNQDFTVADDVLSFGWHVSGSWSNRTYGEEFKLENKNSFTRGEVGVRIGLHLPQSEIFALANANYDTFSDEQSLMSGIIGFTTEDGLRIRVLEDRFSFAEERLGMTVGGGVEFAFTDGLKLNLSGQYLDLFRDSYEGYSGSVQLSYMWTEDLSVFSRVSAEAEESIWSIRLEHAL